MPSELIIIQDLGHKSYAETWAMQKDIQEKRIKNEVDDTFLLVEHEPVYTLGKNADENHILQAHPEQVKTFQIERGGDVTYHGPGQIVGYPILNLKNYNPSVSWYMRQLETVLISAIGDFGIVGKRKTDLTGVWVDDEKVAALGVRISRWVTMHGFALNVNTELHYYDGIIPCGIFEYGVTSMEKLLGNKLDLSSVKESIIKYFLETFNSKRVKKD